MIRPLSVCLIASVIAGTADAQADDEDDLITNLEQSARDPLLDLDARNLLDRAAPGVFLLRTEVPPAPSEITTAARLARITGFKVLLLPHFPHLGSVPVVDGIVFDANARPVANLSLKTLAAGGTHPPRAALDMINSFRGSVVRHYHPVRLKEAISRLRSTNASKDRAFHALTTMLGLNANASRPLWLAVDFSAQDQLSFVVDEGEAQGRVLRFFGAQGGEYRRRIPARYLSRQTHDVWLLFADASVRACEDDLRITFFP